MRNVKGTRRQASKKAMNHFMSRMENHHTVQDVQKIYMETGWLTPTIALVLLSEIVKGGQKAVRKLPRRLPKRFVR